MGTKVDFSKDPKIRAEQLRYYRIQEENKEFLEELNAQINLLRTKMLTLLQNKAVTSKEKREISSLLQGLIKYIDNLQK